MIKPYTAIAHLFLVMSLLTLSAFAAPPRQAADEEKVNEKQEVLSFEVFVRDHNGDPVKDAKIKPWAIGSAQGHGQWNEKATGLKPEISITDSIGKATVQYPVFSNVEEEIRSTTITITVEHPNHPSLSDIHITVPRERTKKVKLPLGSAIEVTALLDDKPVASNEIKAIWKGSFGKNLEINEAQKTMRIPPMAKGKGQFMFMRIEGDSITHFSAIESFEIDGSERVIKKQVELIPAEPVHGKLSDSVPRPVVNGRVKVQTISEGLSWEEISWFDWAKVEEDGTFVVEAWPHGQPMQLAALCDGFIGKAGEQPLMVPDSRAQGAYLRPQVFLKPHTEEVVVEMETMSVCRIQVENAFGKPLEKVIAAANPNIGWWNGGAQIYGWPLVSGAEFMTTGVYNRERTEGIYAAPFRGESDEDGVILIELPVGGVNLWVANKRYQLPAKLGDRSTRVNIERDKSVQLSLVLQPKGLDVLGDWEDLCGLVFG